MTTAIVLTTVYIFLAVSTCAWALLIIRENPRNKKARRK